MPTLSLFLFLDIFLMYIFCVPTEHQRDIFSQCIFFSCLFRCELIYCVPCHLFSTKLSSLSLANFPVCTVYTHIHIDLGSFFRFAAAAFFVHAHISKHYNANTSIIPPSVLRTQFNRTYVKYMMWRCWRLAHSRWLRRGQKERCIQSRAQN